MKYIALALLSLTTVTGFAQQKKKTSSVKKKTVTTKTNSANLLVNKADSVSYAFGMDIGKSLKSTEVEYLKADVIAKAIAAILKNQKTLLEDGQTREVIQKAIMDIRAEKEAVSRAQEDKFFAENAKIAGMKTTAEGIQYLVLTQTEGAKPTVNDEVTVHYKGTLLNGKQFDSSYDRNEPLKLSLGQVIKGWQIGIPLMSKGAKYKFFIPSRLAYGGQAKGNDIPANSTLVFEVELLDFNTDGTT
ncbi:FKBP-type peptidyl-prolyl cis-trans isomerase [Sphingobacterium sp. BIGb0165]|uniref:FKBP-type peptidyl-prolyl cis-trans isomerase n=1 Tax=Sphingobacterium sp. BIGb0165 TaxID=2940615 RepID=UPI00216802BB|nr:FKBP-type peptidyl-prolyl cis-trans isomerase [Sphingobacterium sp. BIGb0165]MCS4226043.1 FKBP-type peptidyl-prolyl cis-trans isomerase FkpA/FKBP-type peptidyl-prolyl cis-trans isomerase FklB [Sphingobacterium sp. BIGb0165]